MAERPRVPRYTVRSRTYRATAKYGNPGYPDYVLLDDHGWVMATVCGSQFTAATVREFFQKLVDTAFYPGAKLDLSALDDTQSLDTLGER